MKHLKRFFCGLLCFALLIGAFSGCAKKDEKQSATSPPPESSAVEKEGAYRIGLLQYLEHPAYDAAREAFMSRLEEWGWGEDLLEIDYQNAGGDENKAKEICEKFAADRIDLIVAISAPAAKAATYVTKGTEIKVLFADVENPAVELELQASDDNVTGVQSESTIAATVDLALQADPNLKAFGVVYNPQETLSAAQAETLKKVCGEKNLEVVEAALSSGASQEEVKKAVTDLCGKAGAIFLPLDSTVSNLAFTVTDAAKEAKKPCYAGTDSAVQSGALAAVSLNYAELGQQAADMAVELAAGKTVRELPVVKASAGRICFNQNTLDNLKIVFPDEILETADYYSTDIPESWQR
ncbi:MAG: ABC transporter substrate-binding protein [Acutalibacter sp.]|nr:ABC transporter substrate-binding protein [Acutalibacter sp.]